MKNGLVAIFLLMFANAFAQKPPAIVEAEGYQIPIYKFKQLEPILNRNSDTIYVYNFWATWCRPCVHEFPVFLQFDSAMHDQPVSVTFISMDAKNKVESDLIPFLKKRNVKTKVVVLNDPDANAWIDKVSKDWGGTIPATLFVYKGQKTFFEQEFTYTELYKTVLNLQQQHQKQ